MENYPFFVIRERGRLNYAQESERIEGAKRRLQQFRAGSKAKQKCRVNKLISRNPNEKISEDDLVDFKRNLLDEIDQLTRDISKLKSKLTYLEQINEIQKGSIYNTQSSPLIEKYVKTNSPDYRVQDLEIERDALYNELRYLRDATTPTALEDLEEEGKEHSEKIIELMSDCRYFQQLIDELDVKVQKFKPDPEYEETKAKKEEIKNNLKNEVNLNEQLKRILYSGEGIETESRPDIDYEDSVWPYTQELEYLKNSLSEKQKEYEDLKQRNQQELDDINNKKRSPNFFVTYRTIEDFELSSRRKKEDNNSNNSKTKQSQFELFQRLNTFHRTAVKEKPTPIITKPSLQSQNQNQTQNPAQVQTQSQNNSNIDQQTQAVPPKKKVIKKVGPPVFHERKHDQIIAQLMQEKEKEKEKPVRRVKETSPHLLAPKKIQKQPPPTEQVQIKFYKKPPKSSQPRNHWKYQAQTQTQPQKTYQNQDEKEKVNSDDKNGYFVTQQINSNEEEEDKGDKLLLDKLREDISKKLHNSESNEETKDSNEKVESTEKVEGDKKIENEGGLIGSVAKSVTDNLEEKKNENEKEEKPTENTEVKDKPNEEDKALSEQESKKQNDEENKKESETDKNEDKNDEREKEIETTNKEKESSEKEKESSEKEKEKDDDVGKIKSGLLEGMMNSFASKMIDNEKAEESDEQKKKEASQSEKESSDAHKSEERDSEADKGAASSNEPENSKSMPSPMNSTLNEDFESFDDKQSDQIQSQEHSKSSKSNSESGSEQKESETKNNESSSEQEKVESGKVKSESEREKVFISLF